jgi:hypothetical protein
VYSVRAALALFWFYAGNTWMRRAEERKNSSNPLEASIRFFHPFS